MVQPGDSEAPLAGPRAPCPLPLSGALPDIRPSSSPTTSGRPVRFLDVPGAPPATRGDAWLWVLFGLMGFLAGEVLALVLLAVAAAAAGESGQLQRFATMAEPPEWYIGVSLVGLWGGFFGGPWIASRVRGAGRLIGDLGLRFRPVDVVGVLIGVGGQVLVTIVYAPFISHLKHFTAPTEKLTGASHGWGFLVIAVMTVVGAPFFEELFFRGLLFRALARLATPSAVGPSTRRAAGVVVAVVADGLLFGLAHAEWAQFAGLAMFGMILATVSYRTGRLGMNMVSHASFNLVAVLAVLQSRGAVIH